MSNIDLKNWSSKKVDDFLLSVEDGLIDISKGPFHGGNTNYRKANIVFDYTNEEIQELTRCANDIIYFAESFCKVMTDDGLKKIKLRDYQKDLLRGYRENRFNICLASRQIGKCFFFNTQVLVKDGNKIHPAILYYELLKKERGLTFLQKIKLKLYKLFIKL